MCIHNDSRQCSVRCGGTPHASALWLVWKDFRLQQSLGGCLGGCPAISVKNIFKHKVIHKSAHGPLVCRSRMVCCCWCVIWSGNRGFALGIIGQFLWLHHTGECDCLHHWVPTWGRRRNGTGGGSWLIKSSRSSSGRSSLRYDTPPNVPQSFCIFTKPISHQKIGDFDLGRSLDPATIQNSETG